MYLGLRAPWRSAPAPAPIAAVEAPVDAGVAPAPGKKKKGRRVATIATAEQPATREVDDDVVLTDADRKVEWRGDAISAPARTFDMGGADDARPLDDGEIASGVAGGSRAMVDCIKNAAGGAPLDGEITLQLLVGADGKVGKVRVRAAAYLHDHGLTACAKKAARRFPFPATGAPTVVTAPFYLN